MDSSSDDTGLDPEAARFMARVRRLMAWSLALTAATIAAVFVLVGYRVSRTEGSRPPAADAEVVLPAGAKLLATAISAERLALTVEIDGQSEIRLFDARTLAPQGRLRLRIAR